MAASANPSHTFPTVTVLLLQFLDFRAWCCIDDGLDSFL
jgi:hypothetical protein